MTPLEALSLLLAGAQACEAEGADWHVEVHLDAIQALAAGAGAARRWARAARRVARMSLRRARRMRLGRLDGGAAWWARDARVLLFCASVLRAVHRGGGW